MSAKTPLSKFKETPQIKSMCSAKSAGMVMLRFLETKANRMDLEITLKTAAPKALADLTCYKSNVRRL
jgi:hypothetical protein